MKVLKFWDIARLDGSNLQDKNFLNYVTSYPIFYFLLYLEFLFFGEEILL